MTSCRIFKKSNLHGDTYPRPYLHTPPTHPPTYMEIPKQICSPQLKTVTPPKSKMTIIYVYVMLPLLLQVMHSQRVSDTPTATWIIAEMDGRILSAHCNCMAGLGESCSHIGAILFYIEATVRLSEKKTVTGEKAYWMLPSSCKDVKYAEICDIEFTAPQSLKKSLMTWLKVALMKKLLYYQRKILKNPLVINWHHFLRN